MDRLEVMDAERPTATGLGMALDRRRALKLVAGAGAAAVVGSLAIAGSAAAQEVASAFYRTTAALNLRAQPSLSAKVLLVMPAGAGVEHLGETKSGFRKVAYQGAAG